MPGRIILLILMLLTPFQNSFSPSAAIFLYCCPFGISALLFIIFTCTLSGTYQFLAFSPVRFVVALRLALTSKQRLLCSLLPFERFRLFTSRSFHSQTIGLNCCHFDFGSLSGRLTNFLLTLSAPSPRPFWQRAAECRRSFSTESEQPKSIIQRR